MFSPAIEVAAATSFTLVYIPPGWVESPDMSVYAKTSMECVFVPQVETLLGATEVHARATFTVSSSVIEGGATGIAAAIRDILNLFGVGCCAKPPDCLVIEAITVLNSALQQFHLSEKAHAFLTGQKVQVYTAGIDSQIFLDGAELPSLDATTLGVANDYTVQHVQRVVWSDSYTHRTHHLRPVSATTLVGNLTGADSAGGVGSGQWYESAAQNDPPSTDDVPFFFEVFRNKDKLPMIRCFPDGSGASDGYISVHITPEAKRLTTFDWTGGTAFDIAPGYVELYVMPLARYAALHSTYMDPLNAPQKASIEKRYTEVLEFLGLASIQPREVEKP